MEETVPNPFNTPPQEALQPVPAPQATTPAVAPPNPPVAPPGELQGIPVKPVKTTTVKAPEVPSQPLPAIEVPAPPKKEEGYIRPPPMPGEPSQGAPSEGPVRPPPMPKGPDFVIPPRLAPVSNAPWEPILEQASVSAGVDPNLMRKFVANESGGDPYARADTSSATGIFQFIQKTWDDVARRYPQLNLTNRLDPAQQARAAPYYMKEIRTHLRSVTGRDPTDTESYLGWFLGPRDAALVMKANPDTPVERIIDPASIAANPRVFNKVRTVGELYGWSAQKMGEGGSHPGVNIDLSPYLAQGKDKSHLDGMQWELKSRLYNMIQDMPEELRSQIKINSGYRSPERQAELFKEAVAKYGSEEAARKWVAPPGRSQHNHGNAADLGFGNEAVKQWVHANAAKYGLGFPMGHEPWHIEALGGAAEKYARQGIQTSPMDYRTRVPFTSSDEIAQERAREERQLTYVQAAMQSVQQDWLISQMLSSQGKNPVDPNWNATPDLLKGDERIKNLPPNYLNYLGQSSSQQDYDWRVRQALRDHEIEQKLNESHPLLRMAVSMADPAGLALGALSPAGWAYKGTQLGRLGRIGVAAADGAIGSLAAETPAMLNKPGYEESQALTAALMGTAGYLALNRAAWAKNPEIAPHVEEFVNKARQAVDGGPQVVGAGAAQSNFREPVNQGVYNWLEVETGKSGREWMDKVRYDSAKRVNSENPTVAATAEQLLVDSVGKRDKSQATKFTIEEFAGRLEEEHNYRFNAKLAAASEDYRTRHNISMWEWKTGGKEDEFQRAVSVAVKNPDPLVDVDPAIGQAAKAWQDLAASWREHARNPGKVQGITLPELSVASKWSDDPTWMPRITNWDKWQAHTMEFSRTELVKLFAGAIRGKNPEMDPELAHKIAGWQYDKRRRVAAGQELAQDRPLTGIDLELTKQSLIDDLGISAEDAEKAVFHLEAKDNAGKTITSRQKPRQMMDDNYSLVLNGRNGAREVRIADLFEDNIHSISHMYNKQMSGAVALANFRIENPKFKVDPEAPQYLVDGIRSHSDWEKVKQTIRAVDDYIRPGDQRRTVESEIRDLDWAFKRIAGIPHELDQTVEGQVLRTLQKLSFIPASAQMGISSLAEFGMTAAYMGWKHLLGGLPSLSEMRLNMKTGRIEGEFPELIAATGAGTGYIRGAGMNTASAEMATNLQKTGMSRGLDTAERYLNVAGRYASMTSLLPITALQEHATLNAAVRNMIAAAKGKDALNPQRMRLIGLDADMEKKVLGEIRKNLKDVEKNGKKVPDLQLDKWDEQTRAAFELSLRRWVRRTIQSNDLGQMNAVLGHPLAKLLAQFRSFTLGAWSKNTLSNIHMNDFQSYHSFLASMFFGAIGYMGQVYMNAQGMGQKEKEKYLEDKLGDNKLFWGAFAKAGGTSIVPGIIDNGRYVFGYDPLFNSRASGTPTQGIAQVPALGLIDKTMKGARAVTSSYLPQRQEDGSWERGTFTQKDYRATVNAINLLGNMPGLVNLINAGASNFPEK